MLTNAAVEFDVFNTTVIHYLHKGLLLFTCYSTDLELREVRLYTGLWESTDKNYKKTSRHGSINMS